MSINDKFDYQSSNTKDKQETINDILKKVTRIEVIGVTREFVRLDIKGVDVHLQDGNKTLKIFIA